MLGLDSVGMPSWFVVIEPRETEHFRSRVPSTNSFRVTACVDSFVYEGLVGAAIRTVATVPPARELEPGKNTASS